MALPRHGNAQLSAIAAFTFLLLLLLFFFSFTTFAQLGTRQGVVRGNKYSTSRSNKEERLSGSVKGLLVRMGGPGSWPPSCRSKCQGCGACRPVHVPVQPGVSFPLEYYPEAWRCKCGNKLFMP